MASTEIDGGMGDAPGQLLCATAARPGSARQREAACGRVVESWREEGVDVVEFVLSNHFGNISLAQLLKEALPLDDRLPAAVNCVLQLAKKVAAVHTGGASSALTADRVLARVSAGGEVEVRWAIVSDHDASSGAAEGAADHRRDLVRELVLLVAQVLTWREDAVRADEVAAMFPRVVAAEIAAGGGRSAVFRAVSAVVCTAEGGSAVVSAAELVAALETLQQSVHTLMRAAGAGGEGDGVA